MQATYVSNDAEPGMDGTLGIVLVRARIAGISQHAVAQVLSDVAVVALDRLSYTTVVGPVTSRKSSDQARTRAS